MMIKKKKCANVTVTEIDITVAANADVFVIPNHASTVNEFVFGKDTRKETVCNVCFANGVSYDPETDKLIQLWMVSDDLQSDNIEDHGFISNFNGKEYRCHLPAYCHSLPKKLLPSKEGETKRIIIPNCIATERSRDADEEINFDLILNITASQTKYRYKNFGNFEDAVRYVLS